VGFSAPDPRNGVDLSLLAARSLSVGFTPSLGLRVQLQQRTVPMDAIGANNFI